MGVEARFSGFRAFYFDKRFRGRARNWQAERLPKALQLLEQVFVVERPLDSLKVGRKIGLDCRAIHRIMLHASDRFSPGNILACTVRPGSIEYARHGFFLHIQVFHSPQEIAEILKLVSGHSGFHYPDM
jgi:hypothetical protein